MSGAKRYNAGKVRYGLVPSRPQKDVALVYTKGAHKYTVYQDEKGNQVLGKDIPFEDLPNRKLKVIEDGADNWRKGQSWTGVMESVDRHLMEFRMGIDVDPEFGTKVLANAIWGLNSILEYYHTHPELDDRKHSYLEPKRIGLDIDEVIADFTGAWRRVHGGKQPMYWNHDRDMVKKLKSMGKKFWVNDVKPKVDPDSLPFEPVCYITSRVIPTSWTEQWLDKHGFPAAPVETVKHGDSKVDAARRHGVQIFVDDRYENFVDLNRNGLCTFLMDAPHNRRYKNVGYRRIYSLDDLVK